MKGLIINEIFFALLEGLFLFLFFSSLIIEDRKTYLIKHRYKVLLFICAYTFFSFWITLSFPTIYHSLILTIFIVILLSVITETRIPISIMGFSVTAVFIIITELLIVYLLNIFKNINISQVITEPYIKTEFSLIAKTLQLTIGILLFTSDIKPIIKYNQKENDKILFNYTLLGIYMMSIFIASLNFIIYNPKDLVKYEILLFFIFIIYILFGIFDIRERIRLINIKQKYTLQVEYINNLETIISIIRKEKHDFFNHLNAIQAICVLNKPDAVERIKKYINNLTNSLSSSYRIFDTGNIYIDGLLLVKSNYAYENNINFEVEVEAPLSLLGIKDNDLISIISNIIDNAFDSFMTSEKKDNKAISLCTYIENNEYIISIANNGPKIPENHISKIFENGFSTKKDKKEHGFGLYIVKSMVKKYDGDIQVSSTDEETEFIMKFPLKGGYDGQYSQLADASYKG